VVADEPNEACVVPKHASRVDEDHGQGKLQEREAKKEQREKDPEALEGGFDQMADVGILVADCFVVDGMVVAVDVFVAEGGVEQTVREIKPKIVGKNIENEFFEHLNC